MTPETWNACQAYLTRLGQAEYRAGLAAHVKANRKPKTFRFNPSQYMRNLVSALGNDDEHTFKAIKGLEGYASAVGS